MISLHPKTRSKRIASGIATGALFLFGIIQFVPDGRTGYNPAVAGEPLWSSPKTRELFFRACADCHSNETVWPWYSRVAPVSWLVAGDVADGRRHFNISEWGRPRNNGREAADNARSGDMPLTLYAAMHASARLSPAELQEFVTGLKATFGTE